MHLPGGARATFAKDLPGTRHQHLDRHDGSVLDLLGRDLVEPSITLLQASGLKLFGFSTFVFNARILTCDIGKSLAFIPRAGGRECDLLRDGEADSIDAV